MAESFINYRGYRHIKLALLLALLAVILYIWHEPAYPPNGGTWLGYTLGIVSLLLILWLMYFGIRKRRYRSGSAPVMGWLSAHVYLGLALVITATLHTGFQLGWNIHTLAYVLLLAVVISGLYGVYAYIRYPRLITDNLGDQMRETLLDSIDKLDQESLAIAEKLGTEARDAVIKLIHKTQIGGSARAQLSTSERSAAIPKEINILFDRIKAEEQNKYVNEMMKTLQFSAAALQASKQQVKTGLMHQLLDMLARKQQLLDTLKRDIRYKAYLDIWLYLHVPLACALLAALIAHIIVVFLYW
jgi:hypothetical protein